jgi:hypothetical protein
MFEDPEGSWKRSRQIRQVGPGRVWPSRRHATHPSFEISQFQTRYGLLCTCWTDDPIGIGTDSQTGLISDIRPAKPQLPATGVTPPSSVNPTSNLSYGTRLVH